MREREQRPCAQTGPGGYSLLELIITILLVSILLAMAIPAFSRWRRSIEYRATANDIVGTLRNARSRAIAQNRQCRVEFVNATGQYRISQGDRPYNSAAWTPVLADWSRIVSNEVTMNASTTPIVFNPNGAANGAMTVDIRDATSGANRWQLDVENTGRIRAAIQ